MRSRGWLALLGCWLLLSPATLTAWQSQTTSDETSMEKMLFCDVAVASVVPTTLRQSPGIVTIVTGEEIAKSGARDLIDVLRMIPGLEFGVDYLGVVGLGFRGNWGQEGKVALLWNGQQMNELLYGCLALGNHYPVDQIKQIEIIRGPGSAIYGGCAELAVINVVTRKAEDINGVEVSGQYGQLSAAYARRTVNVSFGQVYDQVQVRGSLFAGQGRRGEGTFTDYSGRAYSEADNTALNPGFLDLNLQYQTLEIQAIVDRYHMTQREEVGVGYANTVDLEFDATAIDVKYAFPLPEQFTLVSRANYKYQTPWKETPTNSDDPRIYFQQSAEQFGAGLLGTYQPWETVALVAGVEGGYDRAKVLLDWMTFPEGEQELAFANGAAYVQGSFQSPYTDVTVGARYERHSAYGPSFVPRLALTKTFDPFHFKLLASGAFKAPTIGNISYNRDIRPEYTTVYEMEAGCRLSPKMFVTFNVFNSTIDKPVLYTYDNLTEIEGFDNYGNIRTWGLETEGRWRDDWGYATLGYSYYRIMKNDVDYYAVPGRDDVLLGMPAHKVTLLVSVNLLDGLSLNPSAAWISERFAYYAADAGGDLLWSRFEPVLLTDVFVRYRNAFMPNLDLGAGVYNLLNARYDFVQPYNGGQAPLPALQREFVVRVAYHF